MVGIFAWSSWEASLWNCHSLLHVVNFRYSVRPVRLAGVEGLLKGGGGSSNGASLLVTPPPPVGRTTGGGGVVKGGGGVVVQRGGGGLLLKNGGGGGLLLKGDSTVDLFAILSPAGRPLPCGPAGRPVPCSPAGRPNWLAGCWRAVTQPLSRS